MYGDTQYQKTINKDRRGQRINLPCVYLHTTSAVLFSNIMGIRKNITGQRFGRLIVIEFSHMNKHKTAYWLCKCDCGKLVKVLIAELCRGHSKSCGCLREELLRKYRFKHGDKGSIEYKTWERMKQRCYNPNNPEFHNYMGRGIKVCERWRNFYENFLADMGRRPDRKYTIERIDNNGDYEPSNCKWATWKEQARNTRRNKIIKYKNQSKTLAEWAEILAIHRNTIYTRLKHGWSIKKTLTQGGG